MYLCIFPPILLCLLHCLFLSCKSIIIILFFSFHIFLFSFAAGRISKMETISSSNHVNSSSLGSRLNYNNSTPHRRTPSPRSPYTSAIITNISEDGKIERRLETCSYQETEMVMRQSIYVLATISLANHYQNISSKAFILRDCYKRFSSNGLQENLL